MRTIILKAPAKLNLSLNLIPKRGQNGFYLVDFINMQLSLHDSVSVSMVDSASIEVSQSRSSEPMPEPKQNLAYRAAKLMSKTFSLRRGVHIDIEKMIPIRAGLAGGSSDAAAVIEAYELLFSLKLTLETRVGLAKKLGMDVCYCVVGGLCRIGGIGDSVMPLPYKAPSIHNICIVVPVEKKPSTQWAYSIVDANEIGKNRQRIDNLLLGIEQGDVELIARSIWNDFEKPIQRYFPVVGEIKRMLIDMGAYNANLAGSGLSVFGIFPDAAHAQKAKSYFEQRGLQVFLVSTV